MQITVVGPLRDDENRSARVAAVTADRIAGPGARRRTLRERLRTVTARCSATQRFPRDGGRPTRRMNRPRRDQLLLVEALAKTSRN